MADLHHREAGNAGDPAVLLLHGFPESSYMWRDVMEPLAAAGFHTIAPDFAGYGDSEPGPDGAWETHVAALDAFVDALDVDRVALVVHDWGGFIGLWWACENPEKVWALTISDTGFFADGRWHGMAKALRTPGEGEALLAQFTPEGFAAMMGAVSRGIGPDAAAEYYKAFADERRRAAVLEMYRSGDMEKVARFDGALAAIGVPTLLLWGEDDPFAPVAGAHRFAREIPHAELVVLDGAGHFSVEDEPERYAAELVGFLGRSRP